MIQIPNLPPMQGGVQHTALGAPEASAAAIAAPTEALGGIAAGIAAAGQHFHAIAVHAQKLDNARMESETRTALAHGYADFQASLQSDPDPASRIAKTREWTARAAEMIPPGAPPAVRDSLTSHLSDFTGRVMIRATEDAARLTETRAKLAFQNEMQSALDAGDPHTAHAALDRATATGTILPEQKEEIARQINQQTAFNAARRDIAADPLAAEQALRDPEAYAKARPDLTPEAAHKLAAEAERQANAYRSDFLNDVIINGDNITPDDLAVMAEQNLIDKDTHARWLTRIRSEKIPEDIRPDPGLYEEAFSAIVGYDPASDPSGSKLAALRAHIATLPIPKAYIQTLNEKLTDAIKPEKAAAANPHAAAFEKKIDEERLRGDFGKFIYPTGQTTLLGEPKFARNQTEYDKSWQLTQQFKDEWRKTIAGLPPDAPFQAVQTAYDALKKTFQDRKPPPDVGFAPIPAAPFDPAALRQSFGGVPVPPAGEPFPAAVVTAFGGKRDPNDNGQSAFGGTTGAGGREGTAIPLDILRAQFPGRDKKWLAENVRVVTRSASGIATALDLADLGTAEWVWQKNRRPTLDLTEGAVRKLGGKPVYKDGKLAGHSGLPQDASFSVVSIDTGKPLAGLSWNDAKAAWFVLNRPVSDAAADAGLVALRQAWTNANAEF